MTGPAKYEIYIGRSEYSAFHTHAGDRGNWNMLLPLEGECRFSIGGAQLEFTPDTLFMIEPGPPRRFTVRKHWSAYWLHFNLDAHIQIRPEWPAVGPGVYSVTPVGSDLEKLRAVFAEIMHVCTLRRSGWYLLAYNLVQELILRGNMACRATLGEHIESTARMLENLGASRNLDAIADSCAMSRSGFFSKFRSTFGTTPAKYREHQVLTQAQALLEDTDLSIKEIARELNMSSPGYFSTRFRKAFGTSPRDHRRKFRADDTDVSES